MQIQHLIVIVRVSNFTAENAKRSKLDGLDSEVLSLPDVFVPRLGVQRRLWRYQSKGV